MNFKDWWWDNVRLPIRIRKTETIKWLYPHEHDWRVRLGPRRGDGLTILACRICDERKTEKRGKEAGERAYEQWRRNPMAGWPHGV